MNFQDFFSLHYAKYSSYRKKLAWWVRIRIIVNGGGAPVTGRREFVMMALARILTGNTVRQRHRRWGGGLDADTRRRDVVVRHRVSGWQRNAAAVWVRGRGTTLMRGRRSRRMMTRHRAFDAHVGVVVRGVMMMTTRRGVRVCRE